jgi:hypothetical protein
MKGHRNTNLCKEVIKMENILKKIDDIRYDDYLEYKSEIIR